MVACENHQRRAISDRIAGLLSVCVAQPRSASCHRAVSRRRSQIAILAAHYFVGDAAITVPRRLWSSANLNDHRVWINTIDQHRALATASSSSALVMVGRQHVDLDVGQLGQEQDQASLDHRGMKSCGVY
jgi:hypothetical protein